MKTPFHPAIMNIGEIHGGTARNSVAKETEFHGTVRCYSDEMFAHLTDSIGRINKGFEEAYGCRIEWSCPPFYPAVINDKKLFNYVSSITSLNLSLSVLKQRNSKADFIQVHSILMNLYYSLLWICI